jgi:PAS domain S-box-containing protein/putative nucleotidyltransferase with HDIG domain
MRQIPNVPRLSVESRWLRLSRINTLAALIPLYGAIYGFRLLHGGSAVDAADVLLAFPLVILALRFGIRGGLLGAAAAIALILVWGLEDNDPAMTVFSYSSWSLTSVFLAVLIGSFVEHRRKLEALLTHYFDGSLDLLATIDPGGRFIRVNKAWERTLGYSAQAMCSKPFIDFVHPDDRQATLAEYAAVSEGKRDSVGFRNRYLSSDGSYPWLEWTGRFSGEDQVVHAVARDVTSLVEAERQEERHAALLEQRVAERTRELEDARAKTLKRLALAAEFRDDDTFEHTERVGATCAEIAAELGLEGRQVEVLRLAAPLHDVGKIGIPDSIMLKPGKLTDEEFEVMKSHAALGAKLLTGSGSPVLQMGTTIAESHHERWDGKGYPYGLAGESIPLVGRIVAVADVFDALTHHRPYKSAWPVQEALAEIERGAGTQFDPHVVKAFLGTWTRNEATDRAEPKETARTASRTSLITRVPLVGHRSEALY